MSSATTKDKRAKFNAAPTAQITGDEIFEWVEPLDMKSIRRSVIPWMRECGYIRGDYKNDDTGWDNIAITRRGIEEGLQHHAGPEKIQAYAVLPQLIKNGIFINTRGNDPRRPGTKGHVFAAKLQIESKPPKLVGFVIREDAMGRRFYDHEMDELKNLDGRPSQGGAIGLDTEKAFRNRQGSEERDSIINIIQNELGVNRESEKNNNPQNPAAG